MNLIDDHVAGMAKVLLHHSAWQNSLKRLGRRDQHVRRMQGLTPPNLHLCVAMTHLNSYVEFCRPERETLNHVSVKCPQRRYVDDRYAPFLFLLQKIGEYGQQNCLGFPASRRRNQKNIVSLQYDRNGLYLRSSRLNEA